MKNPLDESRYKALLDVVHTTFVATLGGMFTSELSVDVKECYSAKVDTLMDGYDAETAILATEEETGLDCGILFKIKDVTMMTAHMMMEESEGKDDLEEDDLDGIKELGNQLMAAINVPLEEAVGKKASFKIDDVIKNENSALYQSDSYFVADFNLNFAGRETEFRFFTDEELLSVYEAGGDDGGLGDLGGLGALGGGEPDFAQAFNFGDDDSGGLDLGGGAPGIPGGNQNLEMLLDIEIPVSVKMGSTSMFLKDILSMGPGNVVELDESADEPVELVINDNIIARGEVVIVDGYFGFRIKEIVSRAERLKKLKD